MSSKFFLDADGGALAFKKLQDYADWSNSIIVDDAHTEMAADPSTVNASETDVLDVTNMMYALVYIKTVSASYGFTLKAGNPGGNNTGGAVNADTDAIDMTDWYPVDDGVYTGQNGNKIIGVDTTGMELLTLVFDSAPSDADVALVPVPFETTE